MAGKLLLARHAATEPGLAGRLVGSSDVPLAPGTGEQCRGLVGAARRHAPVACITSPLRRARQTAGPVARELGLRVEVDDALREVDFGKWENLAFEEIAWRWPAETAAWAEWRSGFRFPGGEVLEVFLNRVRHAADRLAGLEAKTVLVVTHGGVIRTMLCHLLGLDLRNYLLFDIRPAQLAVVSLHDGGGVLSGLNVRGED